VVRIPPSRKLRQEVAGLLEGDVEEGHPWICLSRLEPSIRFRWLWSRRHMSSLDVPTIAAALGGARDSAMAMSRAR